jgi:hypothetical protein
MLKVGLLFASNASLVSETTHCDVIENYYGRISKISSTPKGRTAHLVFMISNGTANEQLHSGGFGIFPK